jgi:hypothetical protein
MDLDGMSARRWLHGETFGVLGNYTLDLESGLAIELATQSILDGETLGEVGGLDEGVQGRLECHGDGDGGDWCEDKLGLDFGGDQIGGAFAQLSLQGAVQGLDWEHTLADTTQGWRGVVLRWRGTDSRHPASWRIVGMAREGNHR